MSVYVGQRLSAVEAAELTECERAIARGMAEFQAVGESLEKVRDKKLYKAEFANFDDYCQERWGMTRRYADLLVESSAVVREVMDDWGDPRTNCSHILPQNEAQARALGKAPEGQRAGVWRAGVELSGGQAPSASRVSELVAKIKSGGFRTEELATALRAEEAEAVADGEALQAEAGRETVEWHVARARWHLRQVIRHELAACAKDGGETAEAAVAVFREGDRQLVERHGNIAPSG